MDEQEKKELIISGLALAFVFAYPDITRIFDAIIAVTLAFILHELAHKHVAERFGCVTKYKIWYHGLLLALILVVLSNGGIVFAAPGVVMIYPIAKRRWGYVVETLTPKVHGVISMSGPLTNLVLGWLFFSLYSALPWSVFAMAARVNVFLAFFNLLPIPPLDGARVMLWQFRIWLVMIVAAFLSFSYLSAI